MKKACKTCKRFVDGQECPNCKTSNFSNNWKGRIYIIDANKSEIAKKLNITTKGEYAIKVK